MADSLYGHARAASGRLLPPPPASAQGPRGFSTSASGGAAGTPGPAKPSRDGGDRLLRRVLLGIIALMGLVVIGEIVFQAAVAPRMRLARVTLDSDLGLAQNDVLTLAGVQVGDPFYGLDATAIARRLAAVPLVRECEVSVEFPDALAIRIRGRVPVAAALVYGEDGVQRPVLVDETGCVFSWGLSGGEESLPVLSGLEFRNFRIGVQLPPVIVPLLQDLAALRLSAPALYQAFSEFRVRTVGASGVELVAYTLGSPVGVRIDAHLPQARALYALRALEMLGRTEDVSKISEIDFRTNNVVYTKGAD